MLQLLGLVKQMYGNEIAVTNKIMCGLGNVDLQNRRMFIGTAGGYLWSDPISTYYIFTTWRSMWYDIDDAKAPE